MWNSLPRTFVQPQPVNPFKKIPCVETEDLPSGDLAAINPRQHKNASNSTSESHLEPWHSTPKPKPSGDNITCPKSVGDSKLNFGKMQDPGQGIGARSKVCSTKTMHPVSPYNTSAKSNGNLDLENSTIQKQRNELQLLVMELKDRDRELNEMVAAHQKQLLAWEEDRLRILTLEEKCAKLENELRKRNELIRTLTMQHKILEAQQNDCLKALSSVQQQLQETNNKAGEATSNCEELEERIRGLNTSTLELSAQVGQLQAREQELSTMLKLKDKDMVEATNHIIDLSARFKTLESALREARLNETNTRKEVQDCKQHAKRLRHEICKLRDELDEKTGENNEQREEIIHLKQENQYLISELTLAVEREKRKDQLLELAKSKQERADTELHGLRQVNEKQQHDLQLLHLNLASSQELIQKQEEKILENSTSKLSESGTTRQGRDGRNQIEGHEYRKWRTEAAREQRKDSFSSTGRHKEELAKALQPKQDQEFELSVNPSREQSASEAGNANYGRRCSSEARGAQSPSQRDYDHSSPALTSYNPQAITSDYMKNLTKYVLSKQTPRVPDGGPAQGREESGPVGRQWRSEGPQDGKGPESAEPARSGGSYPVPEHHTTGCGGCHCSSARQPPTASASLWETLKLQERYGGGELVERGAGEEGPRFPVRKGEVAQKPPKSDPEWMSVYQPSTDVKDLWWLYLNDGSVVPPALDNPKCARKKSEETLEMDTLGLESPLPTHNNSPLRDRSRRSKGNYHEDLIDNSIAASPGKLPNAEDSGLGSASTNSTCRDDCSPTSKLQRLLAESRQMVANLERSTQVPPALACSSTGNTREGSSR